MKIVTYAQNLEPPNAERGNEITGLARDLRATESELADAGVDVVALRGDGDLVLAAAITALKLDLPVARLVLAGADPAQATAPPPANARLVEFLVPDSIEIADPERTESEIAAWLESLPTLSAR